MNITVKYKTEETVYNKRESIRISDLLIEEGYDFAMPCSGVGKCGKCIVTAFGKLSKITETEKRFLSNKADTGARLACETFALGDATIVLNDVGEYSGVSDFDFDFTADPLTGDSNTFAGIVDIGTTTVAVYAYKMPECRLVRSRVIKNPQVSLGADVVSRLTFAAKNTSAKLSEQINKAIDAVFEDFQIRPSFTVITGNTAMLHFYKNLPCDSLAVYPFEPYSYFGETSASLCIPKCISAFVGADITCGIISSGMMNDNRSMLIDIGTNGEIVYKNGDELICCSAAAGPAFEGAGIENGIPSVEGAINKVYNIGSRFEYTTIGNAKPSGICGSGLIDAIASMLRIGIIDETGYLEENFYIGDSRMYITPQDIRAVQTAKAAVRAAIETVCNDMDSVEKFYIAGSFGKYINIDNASAIGLLPKNIKKRTVIIGNSAAAGAAMMLFDRKKFDEAGNLAKKAKTLQLASDETFFNNYMKYMNFNV